jgi:hypothetical protein
MLLSNSIPQGEKQETRNCKLQPESKNKKIERSVMSNHQDYEDERMRNQRLREGWVECDECHEIVDPITDDALQIFDNGLCVGCNETRKLEEIEIEPII